MAKIIGITNQKGGSTKTTTSINLSAELARRGSKVLLVDADEQCSALEIASLAPPDNPFPAPVVSLWKAGRKIHQELKKFIDVYDYIIVDCPPAASSPITQSVLQVADLALVAFIPSSIDALAAPKIRDAIESAWVTNPEMKAWVLLSRVEENWALTKNMLPVVEEFGLPVLVSRITKRVAFAESPLIGNSVHALKGSKEKTAQAIKEVGKLTDEILAILQGE